MNRHIFTIGHSNHVRDVFIRLLQQHCIQVVVDVRSAPYSRYVPHYNKHALESFLTEQGFSYLFMGDSIGGKPADPSLQNTAGRADYMNIAATGQFPEGMARLEKGVAAGWRIALMCAEEDPRHCHRHWLITTELERRGNIRVSHIRADGGTLPGRELMHDHPRQIELF